MSHMFADVFNSQDWDNPPNIIGLENWDVSNVTNWDYFSTNVTGTGTLTVPPKFQRT